MKPHLDRRELPPFFGADPGLLTLILGHSLRVGCLQEKGLNELPPSHINFASANVSCSFFVHHPRHATYKAAGPSQISRGLVYTYLSINIRDLVGTPFGQLLILVGVFHVESCSTEESRTGPLLNTRVREINGGLQ